MELLDRYLQAVKWWLPAGSKQDIVAELREDLQSQIDEKEAALGRKLSEPEAGEILKRCGKPILVAGRYLPQQYLIGPAVYPMYRLALKAAALFYLVPWLLIWLGLVLFVPSFRESNPGLTFLKGWSTLWTVALFTFGALTVVFALLERSQNRSKLLEEWNPKRLPRIRESGRIPRANSIAEIVLILPFLSWWTDVPKGFPFSWTVAGGLIAWTPGRIWRDFHEAFYLPVIVLVAVAVGMAAVNLVAPYWTRARLLIRAGSDLAGASMLAVILQAHRTSFEAGVAALRTHQRGFGGQPLATTITEVAMFLALGATTLGFVAEAVVMSVRLFRLKERD